MRFPWGVAAALALISATSAVVPQLAGTEAVAQRHEGPAFAGLTPVPDPPGNVPPIHVCSDDGPVCTDLYLADINHARALEGVAPMGLPANWMLLSVPQQLLVVENYERTSRGLPPLSGLASVLDQAAQAGADALTDPVMPAIGATAFGSIYAGGFPNVLAADYSWMYDDGFGGPNADCVDPGASACWGHRQIILLDPPGALCTGCSFVAGAAFGAPGGVATYTGISAVASSGLSFDWPWDPGAEAPTTGVAPLGAVGIASTPDGHGYWIANAAGGVSSHGDARYYGSMLGRPLNSPVSHIVATADGKGYWLVAADGGAFAFGDAGFYGSMGGRSLNAPVVDLAPTPDGLGYWLVALDGGVFTFGDAAFLGSMGGRPLNQPIISMATDTATGGYWLVAADGGIFAFHCPFYGSTGGIRLNRPVNGMAVASRGGGYWLVASDGGIFAFGDARFQGSTGAMALNAPVVGMAPDWATGGYWLLGSDGGVFAFAAPFMGTG